MAKKIKDHPEGWEFCYKEDIHCLQMQDNKCQVNLVCSKGDPCKTCNYFKGQVCTCENQNDCPEWQKSHDYETTNQGG